MGNSQSSPEESSGNLSRPPSGASSKHGQHSHQHQQQRKASPLPHAPRAPTVIPTSSSPSTSTSTTHAHATVSHSPGKQHARARSIPTSVIIPSANADVAASYKSEGISPGTTETRAQRSSTVSGSTAISCPVPSSPVASQPVDVPAPSHTFDSKPRDDLASPILQSDYTPSDYSRPPRLPLPIEEEVHSPGSPIITPQDIGKALEANGLDSPIPRRTSVLSSTTIDDEDVGDSEMLESSTLAPTVPTKISWNGPGEKIYVTGTFVNWERKFKLQRNHDKTGFSATLQLKPGTHHIKFLVDGDMITSDDLPTTVDYINILVNYIEVVAPLPAAAQTQPAPAEPVPIPGTSQASGQDFASEPPKTSAADPSTSGAASTIESDLAAITGTASTSDVEANVKPQPPVSAAAAQPAQPATAKPAAPPKQRRPRPKYTNQLPDYLHDLDIYTNPEDERYQRANRAVGHLPQPPSLPMFMSKSILNGTTPHKDDASVLLMPNHTVLNHLATSSIKSGVLATSGTTRYKRKFLTTIMYKPTSDDG